jgi:hypothetical protein
MSEQCLAVAVDSAEEGLEQAHTHPVLSARVQRKRLLNGNNLPKEVTT